MVDSGISKESQCMTDDLLANRDSSWYGDPTRRANCPDCGSNVLPIARTYFNVGYGAGIRFGIRRTTQLSPYVSQFIELITYLYSGEEDDIQKRYAELYLASVEVWNSYGRDSAKVEKLGAALARISSGTVTQTTISEVGNAE